MLNAGGAILIAGTVVSASGMRTLNPNQSGPSIVMPPTPQPSLLPEPVQQAINSTVNLINTPRYAFEPGAPVAAVALATTGPTTTAPTTSASTTSSGTTPDQVDSKPDDKKTDEKKDEKKSDEKKDVIAKKDEPVKKMYCN